MRIGAFVAQLSGCRHGASRARAAVHDAARSGRRGPAAREPLPQDDAPRAPRYDAVHLSSAQQQTLLDTVDPPYHCLLVTAADTGMRESELTGLRRRGEADPEVVGQQPGRPMRHSQLRRRLVQRRSDDGLLVVHRRPTRTRPIIPCCQPAGGVAGPPGEVVRGHQECTVRRLTPPRRATSALLPPSAASNKIRAGCANPPGSSKIAATHADSARPRPATPTAPRAT